MRRLLVTLAGAWLRRPCCRGCRRPLARRGRRTRFYHNRHLLGWVAGQTASDFARGDAWAIQQALDRHAWYGDEGSAGNCYAARMDVWSCGGCGAGYVRFRVNARDGGCWAAVADLTHAAETAAGVELEVRELAAG